jgi:hypothetical protein
MGKPTRNELLAEYYLRAAGVAAVWIDAAGHVGAQDVASIGIKPDRLVYCCARGVHFTLAYRLYEWKRGIAADQVAIAPKLEDLADRGGVGLTPHAVTVDRALAAVAVVDETITGSPDELRDLNTAFKAAFGSTRASNMSTTLRRGRRRCSRRWLTKVLAPQMPEPWPGGRRHLLPRDETGRRTKTDQSGPVDGSFPTMVLASHLWQFSLMAWHLFQLLIFIAVASGLYFVRR